MEEKQNMTNEQLEKMLRRHRSAATRSKFITYAFGIAAILLLAANLTPIAIVALCSRSCSVISLPSTARH